MLYGVASRSASDEQGHAGLSTGTREVTWRGEEDFVLDMSDDCGESTSKIAEEAFRKGMVSMGDEDRHQARMAGSGIEMVRLVRRFNKGRGCAR